jgi:hypothetical protein
MKFVITFLALLATIVSGAILFPNTNDGMVVISAAVMVFIYAKLIGVFFMMAGHGVLKRRSIFGMHWFLFAGLIFEALLLAGLATISINLPGEFPTDDASIRLTVWCMIGAYLTAVVSWFAWVRAATFHGSEYDAIMEFKNAGHDEGVIAEKMQTLHDNDVFGDTEKKVWPDVVKKRSD